MWSEIKKHQGSLNIFQNIEMPLVPVLFCIESNGVKIDPLVLNNFSKEIMLRLFNLEKEAHEIVGESFNLSSTKQLQKIFFEKKGIDPIYKTSLGVPSTSQEVLEILALKHPLAKIVLEYRGLLKLKSNYTDKLPTLINSETGRIHTTYNQAVTITGRLSCANPNLQNIPIRTKEGRRIRKAFIAQKNHIIISADYSQIELRIVAHLSHDKMLLKAFNEGKDIHCITAKEIFNLPLNKIDKNHRRNAKLINFGLIYGMSAFSLSRQLNISHLESKKYIDRYFKRYYGVFNFIKNIHCKVKKTGYVETLDGRRIIISDIKSNKNKYRAYAKRLAINAIVQGTAADIIKKSMISINDWIRKEKIRAFMIIQIHDELVFEVHKDDVEKTIRVVHRIMENISNLDVHLLVNINKGINWDQAH